jgi:hypothetical protein
MPLKIVPLLLGVRTATGLDALAIRAQALHALVHVGQAGSLPHMKELRGPLLHVKMRPQGFL